MPRLAPFERLPYVQAIDTSSAVIRWLAREEVADRFEYRSEDDQDWVEAEVVVSDTGVPGLTGPVATRTVRLTGLPPDAEVRYRVQGGQIPVGPFTFRTAPRPDAEDEVRILAFGDSGWGSQPQVRLAAEMGVDFDLAIHTGDIAYQIGSEADFTLRHFQVYRGLLVRVPFFPSPGNHDIRSEGGAPYDRAFVWPAPDPAARYYSFRWGSVVFVALDTTDSQEADLPVPTGAIEREPGRSTDGEELREGVGRQYEWLNRTLSAAAADSTAGWTIVYMHHPPFSGAIGLSGHGSDVRLRRSLAPLFQRYGVDLVLSGHDHHYERSFPLVDQRIQADGCGPAYIVTGGGGASRFARGTVTSPGSVYSSRAHHFVRLTVTRDAIRGEAIDELGRPIDDFEVSPFDGMDEDGGWLRLSCGS